MITVAFIASRSLNNIGGIENYMKNLCPLLAIKGYDVYLYVEGDKFLKTKYMDVNLVSIPSLGNKFINKIIIALVATIHSVFVIRKIDIIHYNAIPSALFSFIPLVLGKKVVYQGHGFEWQRKKWSRNVQIIIKFFERFVVLINGNITMVSDDQTQYINKLGKKSITITPGVNIDKKKYPEDLITRFGLKNNKYIFFLGRLVPEKRPDVLINAYNLLRDDVDEVKLVISGDDPNEKKYIDYLKNLASGNPNIIFTGAVYSDTKNALLQYCRMFCIPSELEGLPITLLEAMGFGKLCIASDIPANKEALSSAGVYFKVNDVVDLQQKIHAAIVDSDEYMHYRSEAQRRVYERFTWDRIVDQFDDFYRQILTY